MRECCFDRWVELAEVGSGYTARGWRSDSMMAHREMGPRLTLQKKHGEGLIQRTATNPQNSLELKQCFNTLISICFGPYWFIIRERTGAQENRWNLSPSPVCTRIGDGLKRVLLHTGDGEKFRRLFYTTTHFLKMGQWGPKLVKVDVLRHYCNCI